MLFFHRQHLDPIVVRVVDEVEPHLPVLEADPTVLAVPGPYFVVVACHAQAEVALVIAQLVGSLFVAQPGELQPEPRLAVAQVDQYERAVCGLLARKFPKPQRPVVEIQAALQVGYVDVEMVRSEERRVGKECSDPWRYRWSPFK